MSSLLKTGGWSELLLSSLAKLTWRSAALGTLGIALLSVFIWPHARLVVEVVTIATVTGTLAAAMCGFTFWAKARVQMGRRKLRYKDVRRTSAMVALVGLSILAVQRSSLRLWPPDSSAFIVAVAQFQNDLGNQVQNQLVETLNRLDSTLKVRAIAISHPIPNKVTQADFSRTAYQTQASAIFWGSVRGAAGSQTVTLFSGGTSATAAQITGGPPSPMELPVEDLGPFVALDVAAQDAQSGKPGGASGDALEPLIETARAIADNSKQRKQWIPDTQGQVDQIIGAALATSGQQTGSKESLETSLTYYHRALGELSRESDPVVWAAAQSNLGATLIILDHLDHHSAHFREAIAAFREALQVFTLQDHRRSYVLLQSSIGHAFGYLGAHEVGTDDLKQAVAAYRAALNGVTAKDNPLTWAQIQGELGWILRFLGDMESTSSDYEDAITADRAALTIFLPNSHPLEWIDAQTALAQSLRELGLRMAKPDYLRQAVSADREILDRFPHAGTGVWVAAQIELGNDLTTLAYSESGAGGFEQAVAALRAALGKLPPDTPPEVWATAQAGLGNALAGLGDRTSNLDDLKQAVDAFNQALKVFTKDNETAGWVKTKLALGSAQADLGIRESGTTQLTEAVTTFREVLGAISEKDDPEQWTSGQEKLKKTLAALRQRGWSES